MATTTATTALTPLEVLAAAAAVIRARGYFQPLSRQWEEQVPTAMDVERYVFGYEPVERGDFKRFAAQSQTAAAEAPAVLAWCTEGEGAHGNEYRLKLARLARAERVSARDIPTLCSAVNSYRQDQRWATRAADMAADAECSRHQGAKGERVTITVTVAVVIGLGSRRYGYSEQPRILIKFRDAEHNVFVWEARTSNVPALGARVRLTGTISSHGHYRGTAQTNLTRCRWTPAKD